MTTIAFDGHSVASDLRCTADGVTRRATKIGWAHQGLLLATAGSGPDICRIVELVALGVTADEELNASILAFRPDGLVTLYSGSPHGLALEPGACDAIGSGAHYALGAMAAGASATEAVRIASKYDCYTGDGIETVNIEEAFEFAAKQLPLGARHTRRAFPLAFMSALLGHREDDEDDMSDVIWHGFFGIFKHGIPLISTIEGAGSELDGTSVRYGSHF